MDHIRLEIGLRSGYRRMCIEIFNRVLLGSQERRFVVDPTTPCIRRRVEIKSHPLYIHFTYLSVFIYI